MMRSRKPNISESTRKNWQKLHPETEKDLTRRANKTGSGKYFLPREYCRDKKSLAAASMLAGHIISGKIPLADAFYSLICGIFQRNGLRERAGVQSFFKSCGKRNLLEYFFNAVIPENEFDFPGLLYQSCLTEGEKNSKGIYYTCEKITRNMTAAIEPHQSVLDPACGCGAFLLSLPDARPENLYAIDKDPIAVMICQANLLLRFPDHDFSSQIVCGNFLRRKHFPQKSFDWIITNPPWGADKNTACEDTFSLFWKKAFPQLKDQGKIRFLFPQSVLNIQRHRKLREHMLQSGNLEEITLFDDKFSMVSTNAVSITASNTAPDRQKNILFSTPAGRIDQIPQNIFLRHPDHAFLNITQAQQQLIDHLFSRGKFNLASSTWALGIVTGDNRKKLSPLPAPGMERIFSGKDILPYTLHPETEYYIRYDRKNLQQSADPAIYRAKEKLVYKFISGKPVFAWDNGGHLFLNSANILIPDIPGMSIKTVLAFLNSDVFSFLYNYLSGDVKVLKRTLQQLPFPAISPQENLILEELTEKAAGVEPAAHAEIQNVIARIFGITPEQRALLAEFTD